MKAAFIYGARDVRLESIDKPSVGNGEILVKVHVCGICGTDVHTYKLGDPSLAQNPIIPGHEFSGEIVEMGARVQGVKVGDRVVGTGYRNCGKCYWCSQGHPEKCPNPLVPGEGLPGAMAEYVIVPNPMVGRTLFTIPEGMGWDEAATIEPMSVSCFAVRRARIEKGEVVVVLGAGMIGQGVAQACKAVGAARVIVSEPSATRRELAKRLGADVVLNPAETDPVEAVREASGGEMASVVFECSGAPIAFHQAPLLVQPFGRIIQVAIYEKPLELSPAEVKLMFQFRNLTLRGSGGQRWDMALELMRESRVKTEQLITHVFPLDRVKEAFEAQAGSAEAIKVLVKP
ncbi:MAG: zinc-binding dehydrogenase [Chloroflexi bacterium]|nr:zinc-binding dehydrogenase [Chloroflexota bacterium]